MRTLTLAGIYLTPVAAFAAIAAATGFSTELVEYSEYEGQSVFEEIYDLDQKADLSTAVLDATIGTTETKTTSVVVVSGNVSAVEEPAPSAIYQDGLFGIQDLSTAAVSAELDDLIESTAIDGGFYVEAGPGAAPVAPGTLKKAANATVTRAALKRNANASAAGKARIGGLGGNGSSGTASFGIASSATNPATPAAAVVAPFPNATGTVPVSAGLAAVPLPASALMLFAGLSLLGAMRLRKRSS